MNRRQRNAFVFVVFVVVVLVGLPYGLWSIWWHPTPPREPNRAADANVAGVGGQGNLGRPPDANAAGPAPASHPAEDNGVPVLRLPDFRNVSADEELRKGGELLAGRRLADARTALTRALLSGKLAPAQASAARKTLGELADRMIFSPEVVDGDPYAFQYAFGSGEVLVRVERKLALHVPAQLLLKINGIADARSIRAGQTLKVIRGPFHAIVSKSDFTMDLYLHRESCPPVFVRRLLVGLGENASTPVGLWRVALGSKRDKAPWYPPPNSPYRRSIQWNEPNYPLGARGYWIGLEGVDEATRSQTGYGIHGTNDPTSIGKAKSLGCIRLTDPDIDLVFSLLYEKWSTVRVLP